MVSDKDEETGRSEIVLENKAVKVERVHISGLKRTKADYIIDDVKPVFNSSTFIEAYAKALQCKEKLLARGIFRQVDIVLDTTEAYNAKSKNGIQVIFKAVEKNTIVGELRTEMSNHEKPRWVVRVLSPNVFGRGETLSGTMSHTLASSSNTHIYQPTDFQTAFIKPYSKGKIHCMISKEMQNFNWASFKETARGLEAGISFPILGNTHQLSWQGNWRELNPNATSSFAVRQQMGHSIKSSISHSMVVDKMDDQLLPSSGLYFKTTQEVAGLGGDVKFFKETIESTLAVPILRHISFSLGLNTGVLVGYGNKPCLINDKFFIGGPLTLRGFQLNSVGQHNSGDYIGSTAFWLAGAHIYTPLPFYWFKFGRGSWMDNFRMHAFANAGSSADVNIEKDLKSNLQNWTKDIRLSCGFGLVYKFMQAARLELNFCFPIRAMKNDKLCDGIQFGIGINSV